MRISFFLILLCMLAPARAVPSWEPVNLTSIVDDDITRHVSDLNYFDGISIAQSRFSENGFNWHLIRFANPTKPVGPLWVVPHDDENAAFESMIAAIRLYGGTGIAVNSGSESARLQAGRGRCGVVSATVSSCDPNRNFSNKSPLFTSAFLGNTLSSTSIIALHTNSPGFAGDGQGGYGDITMLDIRAYRKGRMQPRTDGIFAKDPVISMANLDTFGLVPYRADQGLPDIEAKDCASSLAKQGIHFWHERVRRSDGSLSNYIALNRPNIDYFNAESRREDDLPVASARHMMMVAAYLRLCEKLNALKAP